MLKMIVTPHPLAASHYQSKKEIKDFFVIRFF